MTTHTGLIDLTPATVSPEPFPHFQVPEFIDKQLAEELLSWFEHNAPWKFRHEEGFYDCYDLNFRKIPLPSHLAYLVDTAFLDPVRDWIGAAFDVQLSANIDVAAHKLVPGYHMGIHTDHGPIRQTHRLVVQLNRGWYPRNGGLLMLFDEGTPETTSDTHRYYLPSHRSAVGFEISSRSFHAVSRVLDGDRYTLCLSFYTEQAWHSESQ